MKTDKMLPSHDEIMGVNQTLNRDSLLSLISKDNARGEHHKHPIPRINQGPVHVQTNSLFFANISPFPTKSISRR